MQPAKAPASWSEYWTRLFKGAPKGRYRMFAFYVTASPMQQLAYETLSVNKANNWFVSGARTPDFFKVLNIPARGYHAVAYTYIFERSSADDQYHLAGTVTLEARANYLLGSGRGLFGSL